MGVLSDSFNNLGGYATDVDQPATCPRTSTSSRTAAGRLDDEGRAMLENIYDIAPGAGLAFATAMPATSVRQQHQGPGHHGQGQYHRRRRRLPPTSRSSRTASSPRPSTRSSQGVTYFCSAGNEGDHGYLSTFRGERARSLALGSGTFMNFDGTGGTNAPAADHGQRRQHQHRLPVRPAVGHPGAGRLADVADLAGQLLRARRRAATSSPRAPTTTSPPRNPSQFVTVPTAGSYFVAIKVVSGPNPGHVEFVQFGQQSTNDLIVSQQFGSAGGTFYPDLVRPQRRGHHDRRGRRALVGSGSLPGPEPAGLRALQLGGAVASGLQRQRYGR